MFFFLNLKIYHFLSPQLAHWQWLQPDKRFQGDSWYPSDLSKPLLIGIWRLGSEPILSTPNPEPWSPCPRWVLWTFLCILWSRAEAWWPHTAALAMENMFQPTRKVTVRKESVPVKGLSSHIHPGDGCWVLLRVTHAPCSCPSSLSHPRPFEPFSFSGRGVDMLHRVTISLPDILLCEDSIKFKPV